MLNYKHFKQFGYSVCILFCAIELLTLPPQNRTVFKFYFPDRTLIILIKSITISSEMKTKCNFKLPLKRYLQISQKVITSIASILHHVTLQLFIRSVRQIKYIFSTLQQSFIQFHLPIPSEIPQKNPATALIILYSSGRE